MASDMGACCCSGGGDKTEMTSQPDWMARLPEVLHTIPLNQLAIPGSHDTSSYYLDKDAPLGPDADPALKDACKIFGGLAKQVVYNWSRAQGWDYTAQLRAGVRYLDLRVSTRPDLGDGELYLVHGMYSHPLTACLQAVNDFLEEQPKEVVLLDLNHFYGLSPEEHLLCAALLLSTFDSKLAPAQPLSDVTLRALWKHGQQVLVFYDNEATVATHPFLWPAARISSLWPNTPNVDTLMKTLETNYSKARPQDTFYVTQGILTPDSCMVIKNLRSTLEATCSDKVAPMFVRWLSGKQAGPRGINVTIMDFIHLQCYIGTVIGLNHKFAEKLCSWYV